MSNGTLESGPEQLSEAVRRLRDGRCVAFPTETVYGLGADAMRSGAVEAVFRVKQRPPANPLIVHVGDEAMARERVCAEWPEAAASLARAFWPGPLTLVLPSRGEVPEVVRAGGATVGVRCPAHPLALALIETFGGPIVGPSANRSGGVSPTTAAHVSSEFEPEDVFVLDGGACRTGIESTVVRIGETLRVLRSGVIGAGELAEASGCAVESGPRGFEVIGATAESPGLLGPHYRPRTSVVLAEAATIDGAEFPAAAVLARAATPTSYAAMIRMPQDAWGYAARLYAALREADAVGADQIVVEAPPSVGDHPEESVWAAVTERLGRAASVG
ncbi:MAG: L-threonylcarbamoyladenylate synthase [Planctomycetota bacterium]